MNSLESVTKEVGGTTSRKAEHLRINLEREVVGDVASGFERYRFNPSALPELDLAEVSTSTTIFGRELRAPIVVSCMTGGTDEAARFNQILAEVAQRHGLAMGLGSGRALLESPKAPGFDLRGLAPDVPLLANLGAAQLNRGRGVDDCRRLLELTRADALVLHLNPIQEALQPEGEPRFRGLLARIEKLCSELDGPVIVKEVGFGLSAEVVTALFEAGVAGVDVAGAGGTSWSEVERHRMTGSAANVAHAFRSWGIPTAEAVVGARRVAGDRLVIGSGGIRDGMEAAIAIALGADLAGLAGPFLRAAAEGPEAASDFAAEVAQVLRVVMFGVGARDLAAFHAAPCLVIRDPA